MTQTARIRASSLISLLDCALRWEKEQLENIYKTTTAPAAIGTAVHRSTALYDSQKLAGNEISANDAAGALVDYIQHPEEEVNWGDIRQSDAERRGLLVHNRYCQDIAPNRHYLAVEETLDDVDVNMGNDLVLRLTGTLDRVREHKGRRGISDVKTGIRAVDREGRAVSTKHGPQLGVYELLAEVHFGYAMDLPGEIIGLQTTDQARVGTAKIQNPKRMLIGDDKNPGFLQFVAEYFRTGLFPPNPASYLCSQKYCAWYAQCIYHD